MKTTKKWLATTMMALVFALTGIATTSCSLFGTPSSSQPHECESICPICGKCTDLECEEDACLSKCLGHDGPVGPEEPEDPEEPEEPIVEIPITGSRRYDFGAVAGYAKIVNGKITSKDGVGSWIYDFTWGNESSASLSIYSDKECEADVVIKVRKTAERSTLTSKVTVSLNGTVLESEAEIDASSEGADAEFAEVNLGKFWLSEGVNQIDILPMDTTENFDFMSVILWTEADANLRWNDIKDVTGVIFYGVDEAVQVTDGYAKNMSENCIGPNGANAYAGGSLITFPIYASRDAKADLSLITCTMPVSAVFTDLYGFYINDVQQYSDAYTRNGPAWGDYGIMELGEFTLKAGLNTITISSPYGRGYDSHYNFRALIVDTDAEVAYTEVDAEAHVCLSACPECGGCLDLECAEEACVTKCSCAHECENVCEVCGACKNVDCVEEVCTKKCACESATYLAATQAVIEQGKVDDGGNLGCLTLDNNSWRTKFYYVVNAETAGKAELSIVISSTTGGTYAATDVYMTTINDVKYVSDAATVNDGVAWFNYHAITLGVIELKEGKNVIAFDHYHITDLASAAVTNWGESVNFQSIILNTNVKYTVTHDVCLSVCPDCNGCLDFECGEEACVTKCSCAHECENVCGVCGDCTNADCTEEVCSTKCDCVLSTFNAVDEKVAITAGLSKNVDGNFVDVTDLSALVKVTFTVYSESAQTVNLGFCVSNNPTATWTLVDYFRVWVNVEEGAQDDTNKLSKTEYTAPTIQGDGSVYNDIMIGNIQLQEGNNTITLGWQCVGQVAYKFTVRSMLMLADSPVTLVASAA